MTDYVKPQQIVLKEQSFYDVGGVLLNAVGGKPRNGGSNQVRRKNSSGGCLSDSTFGSKQGVGHLKKSLVETRGKKGATTKKKRGKYFRGRTKSSCTRESISKVQHDHSVRQKRTNH